MANKKFWSIIGIVLVIAGITGTIPSSLNKFIWGIGGFGGLVVIGIILTVYGFSD